jgi:hypothetical protein
MIINEKRGRIFEVLFLCLALCMQACSCDDEGTADATDTPPENEWDADLVIPDTPLDDLAVEDSADTGPEEDTVVEPPVDVPLDDAPELPVPRLEIRGEWLGVVGRDNVFRAGLATGELPVVPIAADLFDRMAAGGRNLSYITPGAGGYYTNSATLYAGGNISAGWNEDQWTALENALEAAAENEVGIIVGLWGTVALECDAERDGRWFTNPWNADTGMGGPYDEVPASELCGKRSWYTFPDYDSIVYDPSGAYPLSESMVVRGQWRQEELVYRMAGLVRNHPIASIMLMWEAGDAGTHECGDCGADWETVISWHRHMADYIRSIGPDILVATGVNRHQAFRFVPQAHVDFIEDEGSIDRTLEGWCEQAAILTVPVVWTGYVRIDASGDECSGTGWTGCNADEAMANIFSWIRQAWLCGFQLSTPFWEYRRNFADDLDVYVLPVRSFLDSVSTWDNEPGDELVDSAFPPLP